MAERVLPIGLGAAAAIGFSGAGTVLAAPSAGLFAMRHHRHQPLHVAWAPMVISGVLSLYGLIVGILLAMQTLQIGDYPQDGVYIPQDSAYRYFAAGFVVGIPCLVSGAGMAAFLRGLAAEETKDPLAAASGLSVTSGEEQPLLTTKGNSTTKVPISAWALFINLAFIEAIGLYGFIIALFLIG